MHFTILQRDTICNLLQICCCCVVVEIYMVNLLLEELRVSELTCQVAIVGEEKNTCCVAVETAYRIDSFAACILHEFHHSFALLRIITCSDIVLWLVKNHINFLFEGNELVVEVDCIGTLNLCSEFCNDFTVYLHHTCLNELVCLTTRANTCISKELVQADWCIWVLDIFLIFDTFFLRVLGIWIVATSALLEALIALVVVATTESTTLIVVVSTTTLVVVSTTALIVVAASLIIVATTTLVVVAASLIIVATTTLVVVSTTLVVVATIVVTLAIAL